MKRFRERNLFVIAVVGTVLIAVLALGAINFAKLPFVSDHASYGALFTDSAGLAQGDPVSIAGVDVGNVTGLELSGPHVLVRFTVQNGVRLGHATTVAAKVLTPLGQEYLSVVPAGTGQMGAGAVIPLRQTRETQTLVSTVNQAGFDVGKIDLGQLERALGVTSQDLEAVPAGATSAMLKGLAQLSTVIGSRSSQLAQLVQNVQTLSGTLATHGTELVDLLGQSNLVLQVLTSRHNTIQQLLTSTAALTTQLEALLAAHQAQVGPLLADLQTVSGVLAKDAGDLATAIPLLESSNRYLANASGSGSFGDFVLPAALIPDNVIEQCSKAGAINPVTGCNP
jgi:phospholipid/cholesterol/gamma-HCH transport system substrate-binding protein